MRVKKPPILNRPLVYKILNPPPYALLSHISLLRENPSHGFGISKLSHTPFHFTFFSLFFSLFLFPAYSLLCTFFSFMLQQLLCTHYRRFMGDALIFAKWRSGICSEGRYYLKEKISRFYACTGVPTTS